MPTMVIYSDSSAGMVWGQSATYATARSTAFDLLAGPTTGIIRVGQLLIATTYYCYESFLSFDTSLVSNPISATLSLRDGGDDSGTDFTIEARLYDWGTAVALGDYVAGASISQTLLATYTTVSGWTGSVYRDLTDVAMVANLVLGGFTRMLINSDRHRLNNTPTGFESVDFWLSSSTYAPKLTIVDDVGPIGTPGPVPDDDNVMLPWQQIVAS